jgi:CBS domain containing-hemolysin-like protein
MEIMLITVFFVCLTISFFLSGMEAGVFALSRLRIRHLMRGGNRRARALYDYLENPETFLWTILLGNTLANLGVVSIGLICLYTWLSDWPWLLFGALGVGILLFYAVCELLSKMLFRLYPNRLCLSLVVPFRIVDFVLRPLVAPVALLSHLMLQWSGGRRFTGHLFGNRDELRLVMQESAKNLSSEERTMINRVMDLQNLTVRQFSLPLSRTVTVSAETPVKEVLSLAQEHGCNRLPVWVGEGPQRRIAGQLSLRSLLYQEQIAADWATAGHCRGSRS